jgi:uncharacterized protein with GYD domain
MAKFFMYGKYSQDAMKGISADRTKKALDAIARSGGKVDSMFALLGKYDIVLITDFPAVADVMKASIALDKLTGISFTSFPAISIEEFDKISV